MYKVDIYRNLNRKNVTWSVKDPSTGLVVARLNTLYVSNARMRVSVKGRERVLQEKRKNVHAFVRGRLLKYPPKAKKWIRISYNPYLAGDFLTESNQVIKEAKYVKFTNKGCFISN